MKTRFLRFGSTIHRPHRPLPQRWPGSASALFSCWSGELQQFQFIQPRFHRRRLQQSAHWGTDWPIGRHGRCVVKRNIVSDDFQTTILTCRPTTSSLQSSKFEMKTTWISNLNLFCTIYLRGLCGVSEIRLITWSTWLVLSSSVVSLWRTYVLWLNGAS